MFVRKRYPIVTPASCRLYGGRRALHGGETPPIQPPGRQRYAWILLAATNQSAAHTLRFFRYEK